MADFLYWLTNEIHTLRKEEFVEFFTRNGIHRMQVGAFYNDLDSNGFLNDTINIVMFSFLYNDDWLTFEGRFRDLSKFDPSIPPTANFIFKFSEPYSG